MTGRGSTNRSLWIALFPLVVVSTLTQLFWSLHCPNEVHDVVILPIMLLPPRSDGPDPSATEPPETPLPVLPSKTKLRQEDITLPVAETKTTSGRSGLSSDQSVNTSTTPIFDVISVGSLTRTEYQDAQMTTWAAQARHFVRVDERNDTEADCHRLLTADQVMQVSDHCHSHDTKNTHLDHIRKYLVNKGYLRLRGNPSGWLCAQKRPMDGLRIAFDLYRNQPVPDYLIVADDDTWMNIPEVSKYLLEQFPSNKPAAVAGCRMRWPQKRNPSPDPTIPFGGFGTILTRAAVERFMRPIHCEDTDQWVQHVCHRLEDNAIGEQRLFQPGMSVGDLMLRYTFDQPYLNVTTWNDVGSCLHSDWNLAFYINFYGISDGTGVDRIHLYEDSELMVLRRRRWKDNARGECAHDSNEACGPQAHLCHYVTPEHMHTLHDGKQSLSSQ